MKKSDTWFSYILWVAFIVGSMAIIMSQAFPYLKALKTKKEIEDAIFLLEKMKKDSYYLTFTAYGSEFSYQINFPNAYIVAYNNSSILQIRFTNLGDFPFKPEDFKSNNVKIYRDFDQIVLETNMAKNFVKTFSSQAKGTFYLRNKGKGLLLTNKQGSFLNLNFSYKPLNSYLSWDYNFIFNYYNPWEDIWLNITDKNNYFPSKEFYFFENLSNLTINFNLNNKSYLANLEFNIFTDFGNYWNKNLKLEIPYNSKVNVTFVFDNVKSVSLNLSFNYLNKNWSINCSISGCKPSILYFDKELIPVEAKVIRTSTGYNFSFFNLPTYTNYSIAYSYDGTSGKTWRIFTPFILACNDTGTSLSCDTNYWTLSGSTYYSNSNNFYLDSLLIKTACSTISKKCGVITSYSTTYEKIYRINGKNLTIESLDLSS